MAESRKVTKLLGAAGAALLALSGAALADGYEGSVKDAPAKPEREFSWSATATGTSDYVFRGISQSDNDPAIQGSIGATYGIFYAGLWASSIDFDPAVNVEIDYYAGITPTWGGVTFDLGWIYYNYPDDQTLDYWELKAGASYELFSKLTAKGTAFWSPDVAGSEWYVYEGTLAYELPTFHVFTPTISGLVGYTDFDDETVGADYTYWNAGLSLAVEKLTFDFRYWDTDYSDVECFGSSPSTCSERFVFSATLALP